MKGYVLNIEVRILFSFLQFIVTEENQVLEDKKVIKVRNIIQHTWNKSFNSFFFYYLGAPGTPGIDGKFITNISFFIILIIVLFFLFRFTRYID
jgi:hypothetical protein